MTARVHLWALACVAATVGAALVAPAPAQPAAAPPGFQVYHYGSHAEGSSFREVFLVHQVDAGFAVPHAQVEVRRNGEPLAVAWQAAGPTVTVGDSFAFVQEAFDQKQVLTARVAGAEVMACAYGGGAGVSIHPDEWRAMGLEEEVRCLLSADSDIAPGGGEGHAH